LLSEVFFCFVVEQPVHGFYLPEGTVGETALASAQVEEVLELAGEGFDSFAQLLLEKGFVCLLEGVALVDEVEVLLHQLVVLLLLLGSSPLELLQLPIVLVALPLLPPLQQRFLLLQLQPQSLNFPAQGLVAVLLFFILHAESVQQ
jgi:hypothetical protein